MISSALVRNAGYDRGAKKSGGSPRAMLVSTVKAPEPAGEVEPEESRARRRVMSGRQREQGAGRNV